MSASVEAPDELPSLPAAVEVAAFRIATEAMTNVVRHSEADSVVVRLGCSDSLFIEVLDDGMPSQAWRAGVGLIGVRERVTELGGRFDAVATSSRVRSRTTSPGRSEASRAESCCSILAKLGLADRAQAAVVARDAGLGRGH